VRVTARHLATRRSRALAALLGVAFLLSSLIGLVHEATTSHIRCAEHGELIHGEPGAVASAAAASAAVTSHATLERGTGTGGQASGHEHCQLTYSTHESRCAPRPPVVIAAPAIVGELAAVAQRTETARSTSLYRTAPKTSPPA
jgi:hypothetical protein